MVKSTRGCFRMYNGWLESIVRLTARTFWYAVRQALGSIQLKRAVYAKLSTGLAFRFKIRESDVNKVPGLRDAGVIPRTFQLSNRAAPRHAPQSGHDANQPAAR